MWLLPAVGRCRLQQTSRSSTRNSTGFHSTPLWHPSLWMFITTRGLRCRRESYLQGLQDGGMLIYILFVDSSCFRFLQQQQLDKHIAFPSAPFILFTFWTLYSVFSPHGARRAHGTDWAHGAHTARETYRAHRTYVAHRALRDHGAHKAHGLIESMTLIELMGLIGFVGLIRLIKWRHRWPPQMWRHRYPLRCEDTGGPELWRHRYPPGLKTQVPLGCEDTDAPKDVKTQIPSSDVKTQVSPLRPQ